MFQPVYFDHNATTPLDPAVRKAMLPWLGKRFGNASSRNEYGRMARAAIDAARQQVAAAVGAHPTELIFVSGGSEANNLLMKGVVACRRPGLLVVSAIEHPSVLRPAEQLAKQGWLLHKLAVDTCGIIDADDFAESLLDMPELVSIMLANNETGVIQEIETLATTAKAANACFHTDAVQALGRLPLDFRALNAAGVRAMTISSHKIYGPQGAAALVVDKRVELQPLIAGGGQERDLRSGTENVAAIVGFGVACELAAQRLNEAPQRLRVLRDRLEAGLLAMGAQIFAQSAKRLPNTSFFAFPEIDGETLVGKLDRAGFAVASGSACSSVHPGPSHVLLAMQVAPEVALGAVRVSLGVANTLDQVECFLAALQEISVSLKRMTAVTI
ncbi:MAG: Cysteine desulfurase [Betaproteobacteria bacterium ADurb.Bin341]|nr:MAG: Cysteine desulfurase [Betaproteobacteria bacterium ADurb.Bin341]